MTKTYVWHDAYLAALFETDRKEMPARLQAAESAVHERHHMLSATKGGIPHERQALEDATNGLRVLRKEHSEWQSRQSSASAQRRDSTSSQPASEPGKSNEGAEFSLGQGVVTMKEPSISRTGNLPIDRDDCCKRCASDSLKDFNGELAIHFRGLENLDKPIVWVFPDLRACLECGFVEFVLPNAEREQLKNE